MLFQKTIIKKYLGLLNDEVVSEAWNKFQTYFLDAQIQANILQSKEEQFQEGFLRELFVNVLGYTLNPSPNYNLITEKKNETNSKKADGTKTGNVIQKINYYPFGAQFCDNSVDSNVQPHKYNGKEFDKMHGLNTYDYGARQYNPITARWDRIDPLAEKYYSVSPYAYCGNNPMKFVDPDGKELGLPEEILFGLTHPLITSRIGIGVTKGAVNINTNATRFATRGEILYGSIPNEQEERGRENGAFRHTLWQAQITSEFGSDIAKQVGDAHEDNPIIDMNQTFFTNINDADKSVDLHNNIIGRAIGENNKGAKMDKNAISVLKVYMKEGLYQAKKIKGGYKVERVKLNSSKGKMLMSILNQLDENGKYPSERPKPENDRIRRYEALQNSLH